MARLLIVEDEEGIASFLKSGLEAAGHTTLVVGDGRKALAVARDDDFDLLILDLGLPELDGQDVLREVRARGERLPIIVLTARDSLDSTLDSFAVGASDYVTKPFAFDELLARVAVRLNEASSRAQGSAPTTMEVGALVLDVERRTLTTACETSELSAREFKLAMVFFEHPGQVLSREQLLSRVWGYDFDPGSNVVDVYVGYLRKKLGREHLETVRGVGYRLKG